MLDRAEARRQQRQIELMMQQYEAHLITSITTIKNRYLVGIIQNWKNHRQLASADLAYELEQSLLKKYKAHSRAVIQAFGANAYQNFKANLPMYFKLDPRILFDTMERVWIQNNAAKKITQVTQTTIDDVRTALETAINLQESQRDVIKRLNAIRVINRYRAETIGKTETHSAAIFASHSVAEAVESETGTRLYKFWVSAEDERTRESHMMMDSADGVPLESSFIVGGESLDYPGDPSGSPENTINCRCVIVTNDRLS